MKVLIVTNLYPNDREPGRGIFNKQQFDELAKLCDIKIIAPIPWGLGRGKTADCRLQTADREVRGQRSEVKGSILASSLWSMVYGLWSAVCGHALHSSVGATHWSPHTAVFHPRWLAIPVIGRRWHGRFYYWGIRKLFRHLCREWQPDVVLATWAYPDAWAVSRLVRGIVSQKRHYNEAEIGSQNQRYTWEGIGGAPLPLVIKFHGSDINTVANVGWRLRKLQETLERADAVVCVSRAMKESIGELIDHGPGEKGGCLTPASPEARVAETTEESKYKNSGPSHATGHGADSCAGAQASGRTAQEGRERKKEISNYETHEKGRGPVSQFGVRQIAVIPNGVDAELFHPLDKVECRKKLGWDPDKKHILFVGNLVPVKGLKYLIKAMDDLPDDVVLHVVGNGRGQIIDYRPQTIDRRPNSTFIEPQAPTQPTTQQPDNPTTSTIHRIIFHGQVPHGDIPVWMNAADVFCLPSLQEGCPNVIVEALACGTPVVASNVGGIPDLIDAESKGVTVLTGDPNALSAGLRKMLERNAFATQAMSGPPRTWADAAREIHHILRDIVASPR